MQKKISSILTRKIGLIFSIVFICTEVLVFILQINGSYVIADEKIDVAISDIERNLEDSVTYDCLLSTDLILKKIKESEKISDQLLQSMTGVNNILKASEIDIYSADGIIIYSNLPEQTGMDAKNFPQMKNGFDITQREGVYIEEIRSSVENHKNYKYIWRKIDENRILQTGFIEKTIYDDKDYFFNVLANNRHIDTNGFIIITDSTGKTISGDLDFKNKNILGKDLSTLTENSDSGYVTLNDIKYHYHAEKNGKYWIAGFYDIGEAFKSLKYSIVIFMCILAVVCFVLVFTVQHSVRKTIIRGINEFQQSLKNISEGKFNETIGVHTCQEFDELSGYINKTVSTIVDLTLEAEYQNKQKSLFLANMSHEIRTPMNAIIGMSEIAMDFNLPPAEKNTIRQINNSGTALVGIINDILDYSKIEAGKLEILNEKYDLLKLMNDILNVAQVRIKGKNITLLLEFDPDLKTFYSGDDMRIRQILINLLGNAAKFTDAGFIILRVQSLEKSEGKKGFLISVIDSGVGIRKEDQGKLFNAFQQVDMKMNRTKGGTGLGLAISMQLVKLMGGSMNLKSEYGKGSCFYFTLPQENVTETASGETYRKIFEKAETNEHHKELKNIPFNLLLEPEISGLFASNNTTSDFKAPDAAILVVDDNDVNLQVADGLLGKFGIKIETASSGKEAIEKVKVKDYDIVFMDYQMPEMDGIEALKIIRKGELAETENENSNNLHRIIVALSADSIGGVREMFLRAGFDDYVSKPVQKKDFAACLLKFLPEEKIVKSESDGSDEKSKSSENQIPEDFKIDSENINLQAAVEITGGFENWIKIARTFCNSLEKNADFIEEAIQKKAFKDFTIQVHALKNSARVTGAAELSEMSFELENLGNLLQQQPENLELYEGTAEKTIKMLQLYRKLENELAPAMNWHATPETEKTEMNPAVLRDTLEQIKAECGECNLDAVETLAEGLKNVKLSEELAGLLKQLESAVEEIEYDGITAAADKMLEIIG